MEELQLIVHRVKRGTAVSLVESPGDYLTHINLGGSPDYSPLEQLYDRRRLTCDLLLVTHLHPDQLTDIAAAKNDFLRPSALQYVELDWDRLIAGASGDDRLLIERFRELADTVPRGDYRGEGTCWWKHWKPDFAAETFGEKNAVSDSGLVVVYTWRNFKITITGDQEARAVELLLNDPETRATAYRTDVLIAPRHGDESGLTMKWAEAVGKPYATIIPNGAGEVWSPAYDSPDFARGVTIDNDKRYCLTTGEYGTIVVKMNYTEDGKPAWAFSFE